MGWFGSKDVAKLERQRDLRGLARVLADPDRRAAAARAIAGIGDGAVVPHVVDVCLRHKDSEGTVEAAGQALRGMAEVAAPPLVALVEGRDDDQVIMAAALLARVGDPHAGRPLLDLSHSRDPGRRVFATSILGLLGSDEAVDRVIEMFRSDADVTVRYTAAGELGIRQHARGFDALMEGTSDSQTVIRVGAILALGYFGDQRALDRVRTATDDGDELVRKAARTALQNLQKAG